MKQKFTENKAVKQKIKGKYIYLKRGLKKIILKQYAHVFSKFSRYRTKMSAP